MSRSWARLALAAVALAVTQLALHGPISAAAAPAKIDMHAGTQLSPANFKETIEDGIWLVEHYSPFCHHCKAFVPTWKELVEARQPQAATINFHLGQVDCSVYGGMAFADRPVISFFAYLEHIPDLCDKNNVKGYPSIFLFENGEFVEHFKKERTLERINKWLDERLPDEPKLPGSEVDDDTAEDPKPVEHPEDGTTAAEAPRTAAKRLQDNIGAADATTAVGSVREVGNTGSPEAQTTHPIAFANQDKELAHLAQESLKAVDEPLLQVQQHHVVHKRVTSNPEGRVKHLTTAELEAMLDPASEAGPVFVKYYAPWCGHCKHLAPTWDDLAISLRNRVNVVDFNCDASENKPKCRKEGIAGYPTLIFYQGGERVEYRGARKLGDMETFANKAVLATGLRDMDPSELNDIAQEDDVLFLYLYPHNTPDAELDLVQTAAATLMGSAPVFKASSPSLFSQFGYPQTHPSLLVFKDHELQPTDSLNFTTLRSASSTSSESQGGKRKDAEAEIGNWLHSRKFPTLAELTGLNLRDYFEDGQGRSPAYVAIAALDPTKLGEEAAKAHQRELRRIARAWHGAMRLVNPEAKAVNFVWVNADKWSKYLSATYAIKPNRGPDPLLIIADPWEEKFYPLDVNKRAIRIEQDQVFHTLEQLYDGRLKALSSSTWTDRLGKWLYRYFGWTFAWMGNHPMLAIFAGVVTFVMAFSVLVYYMDSDEFASQGSKATTGPVHQSKYVHSEKSLYAPSYSSGGVKKD